MDPQATDSYRPDGPNPDWPRTASYRGEAPEAGPHLLDRLSVLYKRRYVAASVFLLIVLSAVVRSYLTTRLYQAQARLMIEVDDDETATVAVSISSPSTSYWRDPQVFYETQYRILMGTELAARVVRRLELGRVPEFAEPGSSPTAFDALLSVLPAGASGLFAAHTSERTTSMAPSESALVGNLLTHVSVQPVPKSRLVDVSVISADPALAARVADALADEYVQMNLEQRRRNLIASLEWLSRQVTDQQKKLESSEGAMAQYRQDHDALSLQAGENTVVAELNELNDAVTKAKLHRVQAEALYDQVQSLGSIDGADTIPAILHNPAIQVLKARLAGLEDERTKLVALGYGDQYRDIVRLKENMQDTSRQIHLEQAKAIAAIGKDYESALLEEGRLNDEFDRQKNTAMNLDRKSVTYTHLEREAETNRKIYETLLLREKELQVMANSRGNNVRLVDHAAIPGAPFTPQVRRELFLAIAAGLMLSLGVVFLLDYLDDTIKSPDDVTDKLDVSLLGMIPSVRTTGPLVLCGPVPPEFGEAFRSLRTALAFRCRSQQPRLFMVTSAQPFEGKTTTACNLALALSIGGARVLLIDADMRRSAVHRTLNIENAAGLSDVLTGRIAFNDALVRLEEPGISVLTAGIRPSNPSELLGSDRMRALFEQTRKGSFDWVILDTPPVLAVTDAVVLSSLVGGIAFVVGSEMTRRQHAASALDTLVQNSSCEIGAVLSRVDLKRNRYYPRYCGQKYSDAYRTPPAA